MKQTGVARCESWREAGNHWMLNVEKGPCGSEDGILDRHSCTVQLGGPMLVWKHCSERQERLRVRKWKKKTFRGKESVSSVCLQQRPSTHMYVDTYPLLHICTCWKQSWSCGHPSIILTAHHPWPSMTPHWLGLADNPGEFATERHCLGGILQVLAPSLIIRGRRFQIHQHSAEQWNFRVDTNTSRRWCPQRRRCDDASVSGNGRWVCMRNYWYRSLPRTSTLTRCRFQVPFPT